uniref:Cadherin domain-containing protein n=1 Tax=Macrostomum lignano TaxID=282301 RepID=A0A1I8FS18_9PLAT
ANPPAFAAAAAPPVILQPPTAASQELLSVDIPEGAPAGTLLANLTALSGSRWSKFSLLNSRMDGRVFRLDGRAALVAVLPLVRHEVARRLQCSGCSGDEDDSAVAAAAASDSDGSGGDSEDWPTCQCPVLLRAGASQLLTLRVRLQREEQPRPEFVGVGAYEATVSISELAEVNGLGGGRPSPWRPWTGTRPGSACDSFGCSRWTSTTPRRRRCSSWRTTACGMAVAVVGASGCRCGCCGRWTGERRDSYRLLLTAADAGEPPLTGSLSLTVLVLDENDNRPAWLPDVVWSVNVCARLTPDAGANGRVVYLLDEARASLETLRNFEVDPGSGEVRLRRGARLDYERVKAYRVPVRARDAGPAPRHTEGEVAVRLLDENDEAPSITVHSLAPAARRWAAPPPGRPPMTAQLPENQPAGRAACYLLAGDRDSGANAAVAYQLVTTRPLDRESLRGGAVAATVSCADGGSSPRRTVLRLRVAVLDENDNPPNFTRPIFQMQLDEGARTRDHYWPGRGGGRGRMAGSELLAAGRERSDAEVVSVDSRQRPGQVAGSIRPRDARPLSVMASDGVHAATALVELTIADVNDHAAVGRRFEFSSCSRVRENSRPNTPVGRVSAIDRDSGDNGRVAYAWSPRTARPGSSASGRRRGLRCRRRRLELDAERDADSADSRAKNIEARMTVALDRRERQLTAAAVPQLRRQPDRRLLPAARRRLGGAAAGPPTRMKATNARLSFGHRRGPVAGNLTLAKPLTCATSPERISLRVSAKDHGRPPRFTRGRCFHRPRGAARRSLVPPQPPQGAAGARRPTGLEGPGGGSDGSGDQSGGMAVMGAAGAGRATGPGLRGGLLPHCRHAAFRSSAGTRTLCQLRTSRWPQAPSDSVAAAAAAAEQSLLMKGEQSTASKASTVARDRKSTERAAAAGGSGSSPSPPPYYYPLDPRYRRGPQSGRAGAAASQEALHDMGQHAYQTLRHHQAQQPLHHHQQQQQLSSSSSYSRLPTSEFDCGGGGGNAGSSFRTLRAASVRTATEKSAAAATSAPAGELRPLKTPYTTVSFV